MEYFLHVYFARHTSFLSHIPLGHSSSQVLSSAGGGGVDPSGGGVDPSGGGVDPSGGGGGCGIVKDLEIGPESIAQPFKDFAPA